MKSSAIAAAVGILASTASAIQPIVIKGKHFFYENGTEFFIRGVAYQAEVNTNTGVSTSLGYSDPLADETTCKRDVPILKKLGTNTIRVYAIDPTKDHTACMKLLADNEIYVLQDLSNPTSSIDRDRPTWNTALFANYSAVIDAMAPFNHTLGFLAGNEVSNSPVNTNASAYVKASVRDMKAYIKTKKYRPMGVGIATNDDASIRTNLADYFNCAPAEATIDFLGYNLYSWCGKSDYVTSGYKARTDELKTYSVPVFMAECGCNNERPRPFTEMQAIYGPDMVETWSGQIVYMYFEEANQYGLVKVKDKTSVELLPDYKTLSEQLALAKPTLTPLSTYSTPYTALRSCPAVGPSWEAPEKLPPVASPDLCDCMEKSLSCAAAPATAADAKTVSEQFSTVCGLVSCDGITSSVRRNVQGAYSVCAPAQQLSWAYNQYYLAQHSAATACDFGGKAKTQKSEVSETCKALLKEAGPGGNGTVTTGSTTGGAAGGATGGGAGGAGSKSAASRSTTAGALVARVFYSLVAGAGALLL